MARHPLVVGELAYKRAAITQFCPFVVNGWFMLRTSHMRPFLHRDISGNQLPELPEGLLDATIELQQL